MSEEIGIIATLDFKDNALDKVLPVVAECVKGSRQEEGNIFYTVHRDKSNINRIVFVERWKSQKAIDTHAQTTHFKKFIEAVTPLLSQPLKIDFIEELSIG